MFWFVAKVNDVPIGTFTARRLQEIDLRAPDVADEVCDYEITINGDRLGAVQHRYGDGAWVLVQLGIQLLEEKKCRQ